MARQWYEPLDVTEWLKRAFSLLNLSMVLITAVFIFSEFRFDWVEKMVGTYLVSTNEQRPRTGPIWETGQQTSNAHQYLNKIIDEKNKMQKTAHGAASFGDLAKGILPGQWVTLEKAEFKALYLAVPRQAAARIIQPARLVWLLNNDSLDRIFCEGRDTGINIYFIDTQNRVIQKIVLETEELESLSKGIRPAEGRLSDMPGFSGRIYLAPLFFEGLFKLPPEILPDLISDPEILLRQNGRITRVGIWNESENGYIRLGFEVEDKGEFRVFFINAREWAVWQLSLNLKGESQ